MGKISAFSLTLSKDCLCFTLSHTRAWTLMSPLCFSWLLLWHLTMTRGGSHNRSRLDTGAQFMALLVSLKVSPQVTAHTVSNTSNCQHYPSTDLQYKHRQVPGNIAVYSLKAQSIKVWSIRQWHGPWTSQAACLHQILVSPMSCYCLWDGWLLTQPIRSHYNAGVTNERPDSPHSVWCLISDINTATACLLWE